MVCIYIIELEDKKYYVGKTNNPSFRLEQHFTSEGSAWTKKYKPKKVIEIIKNCDNYDEDKYTIKYMEKYGINNVRGGSFCDIQLSDSEKETLEKMIIGNKDLCYRCKRKGHYVNNCNAMTDVYGKRIKDEEEYYICDYCNKEFEEMSKVISHEKICKNNSLVRIKKKT